jgi:hypothetical protein
MKSGATSVRNKFAKVSRVLAAIPGFNARAKAFLTKTYAQLTHGRAATTTTPPAKPVTPTRSGAPKPVTPKRAPALNSFAVPARDANGRFKK